ncbi:DUF2087 domain-containing protein [Paenibacillus sp. CAU 1782]
MEVQDLLWAASSEELKKGISFDPGKMQYLCLVCGESFMKGEIFKLPEAERFLDAEAYASWHLAQTHGSMLEVLLKLDKKATGLTDLQKDLIRQFASGMSDAEIVRQSGSGSASTIRHHRFTLKEKVKQAKLLIAVMELMEQGGSPDLSFVEVHRTATQVDDRYDMTQKEYGEWIKRYFPEGPEGPLSEFPRKEKRKIAVLRHIASFFKAGVRYREKEVNDQLKVFYKKDYVTLRRYLIQYGYLDREEDCSFYWVRQESKGGSAMQVKDTKKRTNNDEESAEKNLQAGAKPSKEARKQLTAQYQERKREMGVYQIKNNANGRVFIESSTNLNGVWNKERFTLDHGSHKNKELQREWTEFGGEQFSYIVLETVKTNDDIRYDYRDVTGEEVSDPANVVRQYKKEADRLKKQWLEKLQPYGEQGYH